MHIIPIVATVVAVAAVGTALYITQITLRPLSGDNACTLEAKQCPDGSSVGRTGPNCTFAACPTASATPSATPGTSGIKGKVVLSPTCPVEKNPPSSACAPKPYKTLVIVFLARDPVHAVALTESDATGAFSIALPENDYVLGAGESNHPKCDHPKVTVDANAYANATITCDTGIR